MVIQLRANKLIIKYHPDIIIINNMWRHFRPLDDEDEEKDPYVVYAFETHIGLPVMGAHRGIDLALSTEDLYAVEDKLPYPYFKEEC